MTGETNGEGTDSTDKPTRRGVLLAGATAATAAIAGCEGVSDQSFEASPVTLPEDRQTDLRLQETVSEEQTIEREAAGAEVTITNYVGVYSRAAAVTSEGE